MSTISNVMMKWLSTIILCFFALVLFFLTALASDSDNGGGFYPWISGISAVCMLIYSYMINKNKVNQKTAFKASLWSILFVLVMLLTVPVASPELREQRKEKNAKMELAKVKGETAVTKEESSDYLLMLLFVVLAGCVGYLCFKFAKSFKQVLSEMNSNEEEKSKASFWEQLYEASSKSFNKGLNFNPSKSSWVSILTKPHTIERTPYTPTQPSPNSSNQVEKRPEEKPKTPVDPFERSRPKEVIIPVSCPKCGNPVMIKVPKSSHGGFGSNCPRCLAMITIVATWNGDEPVVRNIYAQ